MPPFLIVANSLFCEGPPARSTLSLLELAFWKGYGNGNWIEHDPDYDSLRDEPRFKALLTLPHVN